MDSISIFFAKENFNMLFKSIKENTLNKYNDYDIPIDDFDSQCKDILNNTMNYIINQNKNRDLKDLNKSALVHGLPKTYRYVTQNYHLKNSIDKDVCIDEPLFIREEKKDTFNEITKQVIVNDNKKKLTMICSLYRDIINENSIYNYSFNLDKSIVKLPLFDETMTSISNYEDSYIDNNYSLSDYEINGIIVYRNMNANDFNLSIKINGDVYDNLILDKQRNKFFYYKPIHPIYISSSIAYSIDIDVPNQIIDYGYINKVESKDGVLYFNLFQSIDVSIEHIVIVSKLSILDCNIVLDGEYEVKGIEDKVIIVSSKQLLNNFVSCARGLLMNKTVQTKIFVSKVF